MPEPALMLANLHTPSLCVLEFDNARDRMRVESILQSALFALPDVLSRLLCIFCG